MSRSMRIAPGDPANTEPQTLEAKIQGQFQGTVVPREQVAGSTQGTKGSWTRKATSP